MTLSFNISLHLSFLLKPILVYFGVLFHQLATLFFRQTCINFLNIWWSSIRNLFDGLKIFLREFFIKFIKFLLKTKHLHLFYPIYFLGHGVPPLIADQLPRGLIPLNNHHLPIVDLRAPSLSEPSRILIWLIIRLYFKIILQKLYVSVVARLLIV